MSATIGALVLAYLAGLATTHVYHYVTWKLDRRARHPKPPTSW